MNTLRPTSRVMRAVFPALEAPIMLARLVA